jgi:hypothetical protein
MAITKKHSLSADGILDIEEDGVYLKDITTGKLLNLKDLLSEFNDKLVYLDIETV